MIALFFLFLTLLVREIMERLQHHDLELQDRVIGLAAGVALALLGLRLRHRLDVSAEILPSHHLLDRLQRIALSTARRTYNCLPLRRRSREPSPGSELAPWERVLSE